MATISAQQFLKGGTPQLVKPISSQPQVTESQNPGYLDRLTSNVGEDIATRTERFGQIQSSDAPLLEKGVQMFGQGAGMAANALEQTALQIPGVSNVVNKVGEGINTLSKAPGIRNVGDMFGNSKFLQEVVNTYDTDQNFKNTIDGIANMVRLGTDIQTGMQVGKPLVKMASKAATVPMKAAAPATQAAGRLLKTAGESSYGVTVPLEESTAKSLMAYDANQPGFLGRVKNTLSGKGVGTKPITEANTAARTGLMGTEYRIGVQAKQAAKDIWETKVAPKLDAVKQPVNIKTFLSEVEKDISKVSDLTRRNTLKEALQAVKEDYRNVGNISLKKLQNYKEGWAEFIPEATYKGKPIAGAIKEVHNLMAEKARSIIYNYVGEEGKQAYLDYGNLQSVIKSGIKSVSGDLAKKSLSRDIWQFVMDKAITPVATAAGKVLYKTGEGLELIGKKGATKVRDILPNLDKDITPGMTNKLNQANEGAKQYMANPKMGMGIDSITPEKIAKKVDARDLGLIRNYLEKGDINSFQRAQPMLEAMGIVSMEEPVLRRFLADVLDLSTKKLAVKSGFKKFTKGGKGLFTGSKIDPEMP